MKMTLFRRKYLLFILFLFLTGATFSQDFKVSAKLDTAAMLIGDQVKLNLHFSFPSNAMIRWPILPDTILGKIQVLSRSTIDTTFSADKKNITLGQRILLTSFDSGFYTIPPIRFFYRKAGDTAVLYQQTDMLLLNVHTIRVDTTKAFKPIKGPVHIPISFREMLPWILGGLLLIVLVFFLFYFFRKRSKSEPVFTLKPRVVLLPHEAALAELEKLRVQKLWQEGRTKEYHTILTDILRTYIEARFKRNAMESTTSEIIDELTGLPEIPRESLEKLRQILVLADLVKFAKSQPLPAEHESSLVSGVAFVRETIPALHEPKSDSNQK